MCRNQAIIYRRHDDRRYHSRHLVYYIIRATCSLHRRRHFKYISKTRCDSNQLSFRHHALMILFSSASIDGSLPGNAYSYVATPIIGDYCQRQSRVSFVSVTRDISMKTSYRWHGIAVAIVNNECHWARPRSAKIDILRASGFMPDFLGRFVWLGRIRRR